MKNLFILLLIPSFAFAGWNVGYTNLSGDLGDGDSISLGALNAGYKWANIQDSDFSVQAGVAFGIKDDTFEGVDIELDPSYYLKGMYDINENFFISANWAKLEATASYAGVSASAGETEAGFGVGFNVGEFTIMFDFIEDTDLFSFQFNF